MVAPIASYEPATGALLWEGEAGDAATEASLARQACRDWAAQSPSNRIETLRRFVNILRGEEVALASLIARETGKPLRDASEEVASIAIAVDAAITAYSERTGQRRLQGGMSARQTLRHRPHGVLAIIAPHCQPAAIPAQKIIAALLAGNAVVFKPSEHTPASGALLVDIFRRSGLPDGLIGFVPGGPEQGKALIAHPDINGILFTGSVRNGLSIHQALAGRPDKLLALEMGGNNPIILWDTRELPAAAAIIVQSAFLHSGQDCLSARRLIVKAELAEPLLAEMQKIIDRLIVDHPLADPAPFMGPVISNQAADDLSHAFIDMMSEGAKPICHLGRSHGDLPFLTPAIIDVTGMRKRSDAELFGPVLQLIRVAEFEHAIAHANASHYGLSASLIGGSPEQYELFLANIRTGIVNWNRPTNMLGATAPMGGLGFSGNHRPGGSYTADICAYPLVSAETEQVRANIGTGLRPVSTSAMGD